MGSFTLYDMDNGPSVIHLNDYQLGKFSYAESDISDYRNGVVEILSNAETPEQSRAFIAALKDKRGVRY